MKYLILLIFTVFLNVGCSQVRKTDLAILGIKGDVSSIKVEHYKFEYDGKVISKEKKYDLDINEEQKVSYQACFNKSGFYDVLINYYDSVRIDTVIYKYNDEGFLEYLFSYDTTQVKCKKYGNVEETILKDGTVSISKYDSEGNLTNSKSLIGGKLQSEHRQKYKKGLLMEESYYGSEGSLISKQEFEHDISKKQLVTRYYSSDKKLISSAIAISDSLHNPVLIIYKDNLGEEYARETFKYEYDEKNNWIIKMWFVNNESRLLTERVIEYFTEMYF